METAYSYLHKNISLLTNFKKSIDETNEHIENILDYMIHYTCINEYELSSEKRKELKDLYNNLINIKIKKYYELYKLLQELCIGSNSNNKELAVTINLDSNKNIVLHENNFNYVLDAKNLKVDHDILVKIKKQNENISQEMIDKIDSILLIILDLSLYCTNLVD